MEGSRRPIFKRIARLFTRVVGSILVLLLLTWIFHSPIVRWAVSKYSPEYTGRRITLERFHLNPLNGKVTMGGLRIMEAAGDSVFLHVDHIMVNTTLYKMIGGVYEISELLVHHPMARIVQHGERFNFSDLIDRFASDTTAVGTTNTEPVRYALYEMRVDSVDLSYTSDLLPAPLRFVDASVSCPQLKWGVPLIEALVQALGANGMDLAADIAFDLDRMMYTVHADVQHIPCKMAAPYVQPYFRISELAGAVHADLFMRGDANAPLAFAMKGSVNVTDFALNDPDGVKLIGLKGMDLAIDTVDVKQEVYRIRRFVLDEPYVFSELYDEGDNFTKWMPVVDTTASDTLEEALGYDPENPFSMLAHYVKLVAENYQTMNYKVDSLGVLRGTVLFNDYTLEQTFNYSLTDLSLTADDINSTAKEIVLRAHAALNTDGSFNGELALDPTTLRNLRLSYTAEDVGMPAFAPYTIHYVAHPILSGRTRYVCNTTVVDNQLRSENMILVEEFNFGKKMAIADAMQLPVRLAASLMKDKHGNIDLRVPVEGNLDDPEYRIWPVVWQVVKNLVLKIVAAPGQALARAFDADEDDLRAVYFLNLQQDITGKQEKPLNILLRVAKEKPDLHIELVQTGSKASEAEAYAIRTAKALYIADSLRMPLDTTITDVDARVKGIDIKNTRFHTWIEGKVGVSDEPVQKKCMRLVGTANADAEVARLWNVRRQVIANYVLRDATVPKGAITVRDRIETDTLPTQGQPTFHMIYSAADEQPTVASVP